MSALSSLAGCSAALGALGRTPSACGGVGGHVHWGGGRPALQLAHDPTRSHGSGAQVQPRQQGVCLWACSGQAAAQPANASQLQCFKQQLAHLGH